MKFLVAISLILAAASMQESFLQTEAFNSFTIYSDTQLIVDGGSNAVYCNKATFWSADIQGAGWMWKSADPSRSSSEEVHTFTRTVNIPGAPSSATLRIAVDDYFTVFINGADAQCSASETTSSRETQKACNVYKNLRTGNNELKIIARNKGTVGSDSNPAGLLFALDVTYAY